MVLRFNAAQQVLNAFGGQFPATQGRLIFVKPVSGNDGNSGATPTKAVKTLTQAQVLATANQNDVVVLMAESDTVASTSDLQATTLAWAKDQVHLVGINASPMFGQRSRIAFTTAFATLANLFTLSANGCIIANIEFSMGVASIVPLGGVNVTGARNRFKNCQINGIANSANDIAGAYSLKLTGAIENYFDECVIGGDDVVLGAAANSQILCATAAKRNWFRNCKVVLNTNHATNHNFLRAPTTSLLRYLIFENCHFLNVIDDTVAATALTQAFIVASDAGGTVALIGNTSVQGATDWNSTDSANVTGMGGTVTAATFGLAADVTR